MSRTWLAFVLFLPSAAMGQTPLPSTRGGAGPAAEQFENDCTRFYPPAAAKAGIQGATIVSVHITSDGLVQNPKVAETSGHADLDKAALTCLTGARLAPVKKGDQPLAVDAQVRVLWQRSYFTGVPSPRTQNVCRSAYPLIAMRLGHEGTTVLSYQIENGVAKNIRVAETSGYDELDQAAIGCVSNFQYLPVTQDGQPFAIDWTTKIVWHITG
jgi:TonB family protein